MDRCYLDLAWDLDVGFVTTIPVNGKWDIAIELEQMHLITFTNTHFKDRK